MKDTFNRKCLLIVVIAVALIIIVMGQYQYTKSNIPCLVRFSMLSMFSPKAAILVKEPNCITVISTIEK